MLRVLAAWLSGDRQVCSLVRVPTPDEEDAKRPHREREHPTALQRIRGIGANFSAVLVHEVLYRPFANRRQLASYVGIAPMPYQSGGMDRDRSIGRAGNPRARTTLIQLAWLWLR